MTEETVTTTSSGAPFSMGEFAYSTLIDAEKIRVTLDGETYWADRIYQESPECYRYELGTIATIQSFTSQQPTNFQRLESVGFLLQNERATQNGSLSLEQNRTKQC